VTCSDLLCIYRAEQLERLLSSVDTFKLRAAQMRIKELEDILARLQRAKPVEEEVEVAVELSMCDPRRNDSLDCFFCFLPDEVHEPWCLWVRANNIAVSLGRKRESA
jgi:hypothetical protein